MVFIIGVRYIFILYTLTHRHTIFVVSLHTSLHTCTTPSILIHPAKDLRSNTVIPIMCDCGARAIGIMQTGGQEIIILYICRVMRHAGRSMWFCCLIIQNIHKQFHKLYFIFFLILINIVLYYYNWYNVYYSSRYRYTAIRLVYEIILIHNIVTSV